MFVISNGRHSQCWYLYIEYVDESMQFMEMLMKDWVYQLSFSKHVPNAGTMLGGIIDVKVEEPKFIRDRVERDIRRTENGLCLVKGNGQWWYLSWLPLKHPMASPLAIPCSLYELPQSLHLQSLKASMSHFILLWHQHYSATPAFMKFGCPLLESTSHDRCTCSY